MSVREMLTLLFSSTVFFTGLGGGIGYALGKHLPGYYRSIFIGGQSETFDPLAVGIGQGLTQGVIAGAVIGVLMIAVLAWYRARTLEPKR